MVKAPSIFAPFHCFPFPFRLMFRFVFISLVLLLRCAHADFVSACDAYEAGQYADAKKEFSALLEQGISAELAYNLGSTEVKLGNPATAILWFNRAILLNPRHRESLQNLRYLKQKEAVFVFDDEPLDVYARWLKPGTWQMMLWGGAWVVALGAAGLILLRPKTAWPWVTAVSLAAVVTLAAGVGRVARHFQTPPQELAVVVAEGIFIVNAPADTADQLIAVNGGSLVHPLETRGNWSYVELPGESGTRGWLKTSAMEKLWPYANGLIE